MPTSGELERERIRKRQEIIIKDITVCYYCKSKGLTENDKFCPHCAFPQHGTQNEMKNFVRNIRLKQSLLKEQKRKINTARNILYFLAILNMGLGIIASIKSANPTAVFMVMGIIAAIYLGLAIWCKYNPFAAILTGFFVYITIVVINAVIEPISLVSGLLVKIFIISAFIYGYRAVRDSQKLEKELVDLKTSTDFSENNEVRELPAG